MRLYGGLFEVTIVRSLNGENDDHESSDWPGDRQGRDWTRRGCQIHRAITWLEALTLNLIGLRTSCVLR